MKRTILLLIEFDGTSYAGWQFQPNGPSVQDVVEQALAEVVGEPVRLHASGRTDAGVHARALPAHFWTDRDLPLKAFREGVNRLLPANVAVREAREMPEDFHARFAARGKWYRYTLHFGEVRSPLAARTSWHLRRAPDLSLMQRAAADLVGTHDFQAFRSSGCEAKTTTREIFSVDFEPEGDVLHIDFRGSGFLKNMIRMLVGTLVEVGRGKRPPEDVRRLLNREPGVRSGATAPPQGLCLMEVYYEKSGA